VGGVMFGFFGLVLFTSALIGVRRTIQRRVLEVGQDGIWLATTGLLPWDAIAEVRSDTYVASSTSAGRMNYNTRLSVIPRDGTQIHTSALQGLEDLLLMFWFGTIGRLVNRGRQAYMRYGVNAGEIATPYDQVLAKVREFFPVTESA
jgi:hypothetical protein